MERPAPTRRRSLKRRLVVPLAGSLLLVVCTFILLFTWSKRRELDAVRAHDRVAVAGYLGSRARDEASLMKAVLQTVTLDPEIGSALRAADTSRLRRLSTPLVERLGRDHHLTQFTFLTPDGTPLIEAADPAGTRAYVGGVAAQLARNGDSIASGLEIGPAAAPLSLRVVAPWRHRGEVIGYIELGEGLHRLGGDAARVLGVDLIVTLDKRHLDPARWELAAASLGRPTDWDRLEHDVVLFNSLVAEPDGLSRLSARAAETGVAQNFEVTFNDRAYYASVSVLRDAARRPLGEITVLRDQTALVDAARRSVLFAALIAVAAGFGCAWVLYRSVRQHFVDPIIDLHAAATRESPADRARTAAILSGYEVGDLAQAIDGLMGDLQRAQEEHTRLIVDAALDAVITIDTGNRIIGWNRQAEVIFGWPRIEVIGRDLGETIIPASLRDEHDRAFRSQIGGERAAELLNRRMETEALRRDGAIFPVELTITRLEVEGQPIFSAFVRDITERTRTEDALRVSDARFRRLVELANVVPWEAGAESLRFEYIHPRIGKLLGYDGSEWENASWTQHIHPEDVDGALARLREAVARGAEIEVEYRMVAAEGTAWFRDIISPDRTGESVRLLRGFRFDITERKRLEEQLYGSQKMEAVGRLAGGVAHDFNNLTTAILGYAAFLHSQLPEDDPLREDVSEITRAADRAADLTQQLLAFARRRVIQPRVVALNELVRGTEKMLRRLIGENIALSTDAPADLWPVRVDPGQLEQVLVNLVVNARDAMPNGGRLLIEMANTTLRDSPGQRPAIVSGSYVMISVSDTGVGMDEQTKTRIFEPFFTTKRVGEGTGLGLATCYGIVKQASGYIWAFSEIGRGTTIRIYLPRAEESAPQVPVEETVLPHTAGHETILIAEDQHQVRRLAERALRARGYTVISAENGERAVEMASDFAGEIHLLLTDMVMPILGGRDAARLIRERRPDIRVLFMSGYSEYDVANPGGFSDAGFIGKPFTPQELENAVRAALDAVPA